MKQTGVILVEGFSNPAVSDLVSQVLTYNSGINQILLGFFTHRIFFYTYDRRIEVPFPVSR